MGSYLIPNVSVNEVSQAIEHVRSQGAWLESQVWDHGVEGGTLFTDPTRDDAACAALYSGFAADPNWRTPLPEIIRTHAGHLRDYRDAVRNGTAVTNAQTLHVIADIIDWIRLTEDRW